MAANDPAPIDYDRPDGVSVVRWFIVFTAALGAMVIPLAIMLSRLDWSWTWSAESIGRQLADMPAEVKLLAFAVYVSLACTFFPLPTNAIVAAVATREAAVTGELWTTVLVVALVGAGASTLANLNDYHLFTWMLRSRRVARIRETRLFGLSAKWFARSPFFIVVVFNILPIPLDVIRMLAATYRYPRLPFSVANFIGRFLRYGIIAFVTYWWNLGWVAVAALLGLAVVMALYRPIKAHLIRPKSEMEPCS